MEFLSLPDVMIENVFSFLTYDEVAKNRIVCKSFNEICMRMLNRGFMMAERQHAQSMKNVKLQLPRRESERRYHPLARHSEILTSIETRISMLNMTYSKFIDNGLCCFIPGKVIDEIRRVLGLVGAVNKNNPPPRAHEVLQELRDISSMAIEHFDEKISPAFRRQLQEGALGAAAVTAAAGRAAQVVCRIRALNPSVSPIVMRSELVNIRRCANLNTRVSLYMVNKMKKLTKEMFAYKNILLQQKRTIKYMNRKQIDQETTIADLKKRLEECDVKYNELNRTNQVVGGNNNLDVDATSSNPTSGAAQPLRNFATQIKLDLSILPIGTSKRNQGKCTLVPNMKPRKSAVKLPTISEDDSTNPPPAKVARLDTPRPSTSSGQDQGGLPTRPTKRPAGLGVKSLLDNFNLNTFKLGKRPRSASEGIDGEKHICGSKKLKYD